MRAAIVVVGTGSVTRRGGPGKLGDMDGAEMAALLRRIGWSSNELARRLGVSYRSLNQWLNGSRPIPENLAEWLHEVAGAVDKAPPLPKGWKGVT